MSSAEVSRDTCPACGAGYAPGDRARFGGSCSHCGTLIYVGPGGVTFRFPEWSLEVPEGASKEDLIRQALARMTAEGILPAQLEGPAAGALLRREQLGSTGIGRRVGVPHTRLPGLHGLVGAFFRLSRPVDFDSLDAEPITRLAVVLSAPERPGDELRAMELLMLHLRRLSEWPD